MKNILLIIALISLSACNGKFDAKKLDLRKKYSIPNMLFINSLIHLN